MITHKIAIFGKSDQFIVVHHDPDNDLDCTITVDYNGVKLTKTNQDYFETLCDIRVELEKIDIIPVCYGASLNVFPSAMARDMGAGLRAYKMQIGRHATKEDLVDIFETGTDITPTTVQKQKDWFIEWVNSPRS